MAQRHLPLPREAGLAGQSSRRPPERTLEAWESMVDRAIREARENGDFDDLMGSGAPLRLERNPWAGDRELAFHVLKNADLEPHWMALDKELTAAARQLERTLAESRARFDDLRARAGAIQEGSLRPPVPRWRRLLFGAPRVDPIRASPAAADWVRQERRILRDRYVDRAAAYDRLVVEYNQALPNELRWLERPRLLAADAARQFDEQCPANPGAV